jgi:hypothetical protein
MNEAEHCTTPGKMAVVWLDMAVVPGVLFQPHKYFQLPPAYTAFNY